MLHAEHKTGKRSFYTEIKCIYTIHCDGMAAIYIIIEQDYGEDIS